MEVAFLMLADYANVSDGKLNIMGIFDNIHSTNFPAAHPIMYLVSRLTASPAEYNRTFKLGIKLLNEDGLEMLALHLDMQVPQGINGERVNLNGIIQLANIIFPKPGMYEFSVLVDQDIKAILPIQLIHHHSS